jgi:c-di-GMP-related signal transduction protein
LKDNIAVVATYSHHTEEQFLEASAKVLPELKIAHVIGKAVWDQKGDIRDVISIVKLVRKNDGPEEVEQILSTMIKYGEIHTHTM